MNQLVKLTLGLNKLKINEKLLKYIVEKSKRPPVIITCIGSSSLYNEYTVLKFLTCIKSRSEYTIVDVDRDNAKGIKLLQEIYRKNGNPTEDLAIFVFSLSRENTEDENYFNQLAAFAAIISTVILQTDYSILWKDIDCRVSKWIKSQIKKLKKKALVVAFSNFDDFKKFGEKIFTNELVGNVSPEVLGGFLQYAANLIEIGLIAILNINGGNGENVDVDTPDQDHGVNLQSETFQRANASNQNILNPNSNDKVTEPQSETEYKINCVRTVTDHRINHIETQTDQNFIVPLIVTDTDDKLPFVIFTKNPDFHQKLEEFLFENIYNEIEKKVEEIGHFSNPAQLSLHFTRISNEILLQWEAYQPEKDQDHNLVLSRNLVPTLEKLLEKFQNSKLFKDWESVFTALDILYKRLNQDFFENLKKMQGLNFSEWDLSEWTDSLMSNVCNENEVDFETFKNYLNTSSVGFQCVLKSLKEVIKLLSIYNDEAKNYLSNNMQKNCPNKNFEDQFSEFLQVCVSKSEFDENSLFEYFPQILDQSIKIRNQIYEKIYQENENCTKMAKFMKSKVESKLNEFFPPKTLSTLKQIKSVVNELKTFCFEFYFEKFQIEHGGVLNIWLDFEIDMENVVKNSLLKIDAYGSELEKEILVIETSTYKLAESNLKFDELQKNIEANFLSYSYRKKVNICINLGYDIIQVMFLNDKNGNINPDTPSIGKSFKNQIGIDSQGFLCFGQNADNLQNIIYGSEILNPDSQFVYEIGSLKLSKLKLLALFLKYIKINLEEKQSAQIKKCILVVPTFMSMGLKSLLKMSAQIAGLNDVEILSESLAVAIYYYHEVFEKNQNASESEFLLFNKVESSQVESWLFLMKKEELQMREQVNCAMLQDFTYDKLYSNGLIMVPVADTEIPKIVKNSNYRCLKKYEGFYSSITSTSYIISFRNILYSSEEKFRKILKKETNATLNHPSASLGGIIWANKEFINDSNLKNLKISTSTPFIINISTLNENFSKSLKLYEYNEFYHEPSKWNTRSLSLKTIGSKGSKNLNFKISEGIANNYSEIWTILNQIQLKIESFEEDEITWNFDQDGTVNFFLLVEQPIKRLIPIKYTWIFDSTLLDEANLENSSKQVEKVFSCESNEILEEKMRLQELVKKSKSIMNLKKDLNETLKGRLVEIFREIDIALGNEESSKDHLKGMKERLEKYYKIISK